MKRINLLALICGTLLLTSCSQKQKSLVILPRNDSIEYMGRINFTENPDAAELFWSGSSIGLNFEGTWIKASLKDEKGENYFNIIIDNDSVFMLSPDSVLKQYVLAQNLAPGKHTVQIFKRTEYDKGKTVFYGFELDRQATILPAVQRKHSIEFYGNSITAGYAVEDTTNQDRPDSIYTNNYLSYAALTARYFDADYTCICKSGIGIMISWFPYIMPEIYDRLDPSDKNSKWDFSAKTPDLVVINLFQNDSWLVLKPERQEFKTNFGENPPNERYIVNAYKDFVKSIRKAYPKTPIICALGSMDITREGSPWPGYVEKAVKELDDNMLYTHFFKWKDTDGHPTVREHQIMAQDLSQYIKKNIGW
jgi:hypothetical protein